MRVYVNDANLDAFDKKLRRVRKIADRLGIPFHVERVGHEWIPVGDENFRGATLQVDENGGWVWVAPYTIFEMSDEIPRYGGYRILGTMKREPEGVFFYGFGDEDVSGYADDFRCDHCHTNRDRNKVIFIEDEDGNVKSIGSTCIEDYFGSKDPMYYFSYSGYIDDLERGEIDEDENGSPTVPSSLSLKEVVGTAIDVIRKQGYISVSSAGESGKFPTRDIVYEQMIENRMTGKAPDVDPDEVDAALDWIRQRIENAIRENGNTAFLHNSKAVFDGDLVSLKSLGIISYWVNKWINRGADVDEEKPIPSIDEHIMKFPVGTTLVDHPVVVKKVVPVQGRYGVSKLVIMEDDDRFQFSTFTKRNIAVGDRIRINAVSKGMTPYDQIGLKLTKITSS